jgi:hypothetical protein
MYFSLELRAGRPSLTFEAGDSAACKLTFILREVSLKNRRLIFPPQPDAARTG